MKKIKFGLIINHILTLAKEENEVITWTKVNILLFLIDGISRVDNPDGFVDEKYYLLDGVPCSESIYYVTKYGQWLNTIAEPILFCKNGTKVRSQLSLSDETAAGKIICSLSKRIIKTFIKGGDLDLNAYVKNEIINGKKHSSSYMGPLNENYVDLLQYLNAFRELLDYVSDVPFIEDAENIVTLGQEQ